MVLMAGMELPAQAIRDQISSAIHLIVQQARFSDGTRKVTHVSEVTGLEGDMVTLQHIYEFKRTGIDEDGRVLGYHTATGNIPTFVHRLREEGVEVDLSMFEPTEPE